MTNNKLRAVHCIVSMAVILTGVVGCADNKMSEENITREASKGDARAQCLLGEIYAKQKHNPEEAVKWFRKSADRGDGMGAFSLAQAYARGEGVIKDDAEAVRWYLVAAKHGVPGAQHALAVKYTLGQGVAKNVDEAAKWYQKAAEQGLADAQYCLGMRYARAEGVKLDDSAASKWFRRAADQGVRHAQLQLAQRYATGEGVSKDLIEAYKWSVISGNERQKQKVASKMTPKEIAEGQSRAARFAPVLELDFESPPTSNTWLWGCGVGIAGLYGGAITCWIRSRRKSSS